MGSTASRRHNRTIVGLKLEVAAVQRHSVVLSQSNHCGIETRGELRHAGAGGARHNRTIVGLKLPPSPVTQPQIPLVTIEPLWD